LNWIIGSIFSGEVTLNGILPIVDPDFEYLAVLDWSIQGALHDDEFLYSVIPGAFMTTYHQRTQNLGDLNIAFILGPVY